MRNWHFCGSITVILIVPMLYFLCISRTGEIAALKGIDFVTCPREKDIVCSQLPSRHYKDFYLNNNSRDEIVKLRNQIASMVNTKDSITGFHLILTKSSTYQDFVNGIDISWNAGAPVIAHNDDSFWVFVPSTGEIKAAERAFRKQFGEPMSFE